MSNEPVERKANAEAEGVPANQVADDAEFESSGHASTSGTASLLSNPPTPRLTRIASISLAIFLFGGTTLFVTGVALWTFENVGPYATLSALGLSGIVVAFLLAQVYSRRGWV